MRFFFGTRESAATLLDVLGVPPAARPELLAAADRHLADGAQHPPARMVIDVTRWSGTTAAKALFESLRTQMVEPALVTPAVLLVTTSLHEDLPRSFDKIAGLRIVVADSDQGDDPAQELLADGTLLASPTPATDPSYWLAIDFDEPCGRLVLEPADGLARFAREGKLALPPVEHDLATSVVDLPVASVPVPVPGGPLEVRRLMTRLRQESEAAGVSHDPTVRLAIAKALGVVATSTLRDRIDADVRAAIAGLGGQAPITATAADLERTLSRARRRPVGATVMRVGDEINVVNPPDGQPGLAHPRVQVHRVAAPEPELARLRAAIAGWTVGDFEADPFLAGVIERLDPDGRDRLAFLHARAWLLALGIDDPEPGPLVHDWRAAMMQLLVGDVPAPWLLLPNSPDMHATGFVAVGSAPGAPAGVELDEHTRLRLVHVASPLASVPVAHGDRVQAVQLIRDDVRPYYHPPSTPQLPLPSRRKSDSEQVGDSIDDEWLSAFDAFAAESALATRHRSGSAVKLSEVDGLPWLEADRALAMTWLALQATVPGNLAVRSRDGSVTLSLGGGLVAVVNVTSTAEDHGALKACLCTRRGGYDARYLLDKDVPAGVGSVSFQVPARLVLLGGRTRAEIRFDASPLLFGVSAAGLASQASIDAMYAEIAAAEARRRIDDDNEDD